MRTVTCPCCGCQIDPRITELTAYRHDWGWMQLQLSRFPEEHWDDILERYAAKRDSGREQVKSLGLAESRLDGYARTTANTWLRELPAILFDDGALKALLSDPMPDPASGSAQPSISR